MAPGGRAERGQDPEPEDEDRAGQVGSSHGPDPGHLRRSDKRGGGTRRGRDGGGLQRVLYRERHRERAEGAGEHTAHSPARRRPGAGARRGRGVPGGYPDIAPYQPAWGGSREAGGRQLRRADRDPRRGRGGLFGRDVQHDGRLPKRRLRADQAREGARERDTQRHDRRCRRRGQGPQRRLPEPARA